MTDWSAIDYDDPCALLAVLRPLYYARLGGQSARMTQHGDTRFEAFEGMPMRDFAAEIRRLESACKLKQTGKSPRNVIIAG